MHKLDHISYRSSVSTQPAYNTLLGTPLQTPIVNDNASVYQSYVGLLPEQSYA